MTDFVEGARRIADETARLQNIASAPESSAWVSANAGSGKTHVLTQRVIRLMLAGARPASILCLTYTKAAASEMSIRVFERLSRWTSLDDATLSQEIAQMEGAVPDRLRLMEARRLFARALETPGGLKIQTIHAFCEALLHQFPLEANVAGHFNVLDDKAAASLISEARRALLSATQAEEDGKLAGAFHQILSIADESGLDRLLSDLIAQRAAVSRFLHHADQSDGVEKTLRRGYGLPDDLDEQKLAESIWPLAGFGIAEIDDYIALGKAKGGAKIQETLYRLTQARTEADPVPRLKWLRTAFLKQDEMPYGDVSLASKAMLEADPALCEAAFSARELVHQAWQTRKLLNMLGATQAALTLGRRLIHGYESLKRERAFLDFEDFIVRTEALLTKDEIGPWVHYKLDQGIDHILVDEAQDTSPAQWQIIRSLSEEFFAGESARALNRTIFAVGDEKQSIYSFQGARPERFAIESQSARARAVGAGKIFHPINLRVSFRSTEDVLTAVDQVFAHGENAKGLSALGDPVEHVSNRIGQAGSVDIWDILAEEGGEDPEDDWLAPFDRLPERSSAAEMARRIAAAIEAMVGREAIITRNGPRIIEPGDILVLVRKRDAFAAALAKELKTRRGIPVAGVDRLVLSSHIAIQDLLSVGRFVTLGADDLAIAELVKSPLFNLGEDDLFTLAALRTETQTLWQRLEELAGTDPSWQSVHDRLKRWRQLGRSLRPHDFYATLLGAEGGRRAFLARFGHEVSDVLDEFLNFALAHEQAGLPGLTGFVSTMERDSPEIKREQDKGRNDVRIMTVHASKGLEAPVVFLVDGGSKPFDKTLLPQLRLFAAPSSPLPIPAWLPKKEYQNRLSSDDDDRLRQAAEEEYRRLLYVGMTRASDKLIVCGYRKKRETEGTWAKLVQAALAADDKRCQPADYVFGALSWSGYRWRHHEEATSAPAEKSSAGETPKPLPPQELHAALPPAPRLPRPLAPSGAHAMIDDEEGDRIVGSALFDAASHSRMPEIRGKIMHRLLQKLPEKPRAEWQEAAGLYVERALPLWQPEERGTLIAGVLAILEEDAYIHLFGPESRAEVSLMGTIELGGKPFSVTGRIDRLGVHDDRVFVLDYKTNRQPPADQAQIPFAHRAQLALYRKLLEPLYPGKSIECLLLYTEGPDLYSLTDADVEKALLDLSAK